MISELERGIIGARNEMQATVWLLNHGYQVFRNVSAHGPIDLIGMKDGVFTYFDVKMAYRSIGTETRCVRITEKQAEIGVQLILVFDDGFIEIDATPLVRGRQRDFPSKICPNCGNEFSPTKHGHKICSEECWKKKRRQQHHASA